MTIGMQIALFAFIFLLVEATFELRSSGSCMAASSTATAISSKINRRHARLHTDDDTHSPTTDTRILPNAVTSMFDLLSVDGGSFDIVASTQTVTSTPLQQSSWYTHLLPIYPSEMPKFLCLSFMMFWIVFIFTMTRDTKDALVITNCGAEAIAFLKVYGVVPAAALFMVAYAQLANVFSTRALFYITVTPFIAFYCLFAFVLYPLRHVLHPMSIPVPSGGLSFAVNLLRYWTFSLYYIVSELWGSAGIPLLFWSCANDVIRIEQVTYCTDESCRGELLPSSIVPPPFDCLAIYTQAKRIYPWISMIGNLGPILSGITMSVVSKHVAAHISNDEAAFEVSLKVLTGAMMVAGGIVGCLHWLTYVLNEREGSTVASSVSSTKSSGSGSKGKSAAVASAVAKVDGKDKEVKRGDKKKKKMSFLESIQVLAADPYLSQVAVMVLSYGLTMEFTEIIWKASVKKAFPIKTDYLAFMGRYSTLVGSAAFIMMFVGSNTVKFLGWRAGALMTPGMMGLLAAPFFICLTGGGMRGSHATLLVAVYIGLVQNVLSKATKYAIFDPTKEMTYIPLDKDSKTKGKAAIDVLGARLGKSGGALVQQILVVLFGSIMSGAPVLAVLFYAVIIAWIAAVNKLSPMFAAKSSEMEKSMTGHQ